MDYKVPPTPLNNFAEIPLEVLERFIEKIDYDGPNGCWLWMANLNDSGYGTFRWGVQGTSPVRAHRLCYELSVGPIPSGLQLHHLVREKGCVGPQCVNPDHLEPITPKDHVVHKSVGSVGYIAARQTHCIRGHEFTPDSVQVRAGGKKQCKICLNAAKHAKYVPHPKVPKTHCSKGHPLSGENLVIYTTSRGKDGRGCRSCRRSAIQKHFAENSGEINRRKREKRKIR